MMTRPKHCFACVVPHPVVRFTVGLRVE